MDVKDYYKTLGIDRKADEAAIKRAYRKLARQYHPDRNKDADAAQRMAEINEANTVLSDPEKRAAYDAYGANGMNGGTGFRPPPGWEGRQGFGAGQAGEPFGDFFSSMFGQGRRGGFGADAFGAQAGFGNARQAAPRAGQDSETRIEIDVEDAYQGATKRITLSGGSAGARTLDVTIPKGIRAGQKIRLAGYGHAGVAGGPPGDLLLEVAFRADARYRVEASDVIQRVLVAPWEAALGADITVQTLAGELTVAVPPGSIAGRKLRLKGRGLPGKTPGDYFLELQIALPPADTPRARELYETMARELAFDPRA